jgi:hypothetical protein
MHELRGGFEEAWRASERRIPVQRCIMDYVGQDVYNLRRGRRVWASDAQVDEGDTTRPGISFDSL